MINQSKIIVVDCYVDKYFAEIWAHENPQYPVYDKTGNLFVVTFDNFTLLWSSNLHTYIGISTLHSEW